MIYFNAVDYAMKDSALVHMLSLYRNKLSTTGQIILISASFLDQRSKKSFVRFIKDIIKAVLDSLEWRSRGQLWGWMRTRNEYQQIMVKAGLVNIEDGFIKTDRQTTYYIIGKLGKNIL